MTCPTDLPQAAHTMARGAGRGEKGRGEGRDDDTKAGRERGERDRAIRRQGGSGGRKKGSLE